jgi:glycosyltransferase involved in cell wall biosynthesis
MSETPPKCVDAMLSIIIPAFNERENIGPLCRRIETALAKLGYEYEVIFIDDGSTDGSVAELRREAAADARLKVITLRRNQGQTAAIMAGIDHSVGDIIVPMDADLQNDPEDIGALIAKLGEGYDVVSGWRKERRDDPIRRNLPSRVANWLISRISGVHLHDFGCSLKAYRRDVLKDVKLYGEMHRFVPIYATWHGGRVAEIPVRHHPRVAGKTKYGLDRIAKVLLDLMVVKFLALYETKPIYVFGAFGLICFAISLASGVFAVWLKVTQDISFIQTPLPLLVVMTFITGVLCLLLGLLAEILIRVYYESQRKPVYFVRERINFEDAL